MGSEAGRGGVMSASLLRTLGTFALLTTTRASTRPRTATGGRCDGHADRSTFDPLLQTNGTLMHNLACHYAVGGDKPRLLQSATAARRLGKPCARFMADKDFERYWQDAEFLQALK